MLRQFWLRWSKEYLTTLRRLSKWHKRLRNLQKGDIVVLQEDGMIPTKWQLARVVEIHPGRDDIERVATVKTEQGTYYYPMTIKTQLNLIINIELLVHYSLCKTTIGLGRRYVYY